MRVIAGSAHSVRLQYPKCVKIRPTSDRVREALFSSLHDEIVGSRFCDLYAGAGSVGIEALSRGAEFTVFVDSNRRCTEALRQNLENTDLAYRAQIVTGRLPNCFTQVWQNFGPFDIVFADPPYSADPNAMLEEAAEVVSGSDVLLILQCGSQTELRDAEFNQVNRREFGETVVVRYRLTT